MKSVVTVFGSKTIGPSRDKNQKFGEKAEKSAKSE